MPADDGDERRNERPSQLPHSPGRRISAAPLAHRVRKVLRRAKSVEEAAAETRIFDPGALGERPPAFRLPGQMDRVREVQWETTLDHEITRVDGGPVEHAPTIGYRLVDAQLSNGVVYAGSTRWCATAEPESLVPSIEAHPPHYTRAALSSSAVGNRYFGHFISDDCCTALLGRELAPVVFASTGADRSEHSLRYLDIFGIHGLEVDSARFDELWVFQDFGMNAHKRKRLDTLRRHVATIPRRRKGHGVFFRRSTSGRPRNLANEPELEEALRRQDYEIVDVMTQSVDEIIKVSRDAAIIAGVEGSAVYHGILACAPDAAVVCIMPPYRFNNVLKDHTDCLGMRYGFVVGEGTADAFTVPPDMLLRTLDLANP